MITDKNEYVGCELCDARHNGFIEGFAIAKGWAHPLAWEMGDPRMQEITKQYRIAQAVAMDISESDGHHH